MEAKAVHGLAVPIDYEIPKPHELWTPNTYNKFCVERAVDKKTVSRRK